MIKKRIINILSRLDRTRSGLWTGEEEEVNKTILAQSLLQLNELGVKDGVITDGWRKRLGLYPYSPMKPMGNLADNIERG